MAYESSLSTKYGPLHFDEFFAALMTHLGGWGYNRVAIKELGKRELIWDSIDGLCFSYQYLKRLQQIFLLTGQIQLATADLPRPSSTNVV